MRVVDLDVAMAEFDRTEDEKQKWLESRPICSICGERIQETSALLLDGEWICDRCVMEHTEWIEE